MTLREGLSLIQPSPYGEPDDNLLVRFDHIEREGGYLRAMFKVGMYTNSGEFYSDRIGIAELVSRNSLVSWCKGKRGMRNLEPPLQQELDHEGYELHSPVSFYQWFEQVIQQEKQHDAETDAAGS